MSIDDRLTATGDDPAPVAARKRRPIRGALSGLLLGLGVLLLLLIYSAATFTSLLPFVLILVAFLVLGTMVGLFAPARGRRA
ncbi:MAG TPA: hypothetical protein VHX15_17510 [Frankiaceae bacterium]|nr:hypothetical protein [Frankiaceae bacterium]